MDNVYNVDFLMPKELRLILAIINNNEESKVCLRKELINDIDWDLFLELGRHHRLYPLVYSKLNNLDKKLLPQNVLQSLQHEYKYNTFKMIQLSGEMDFVSRLFSENQIRLLFLKGPVIANDIYGDISLRTSKDLDILLPRDDLKKADELLLNFGYEREEIPFGKLKWMNHHISYFHPQKKIELEIHWRTQPPFTKEPSFDELWERKRISDFTSFPIYFLGKEDLFLYLVEHGSRHGWFRLRWLADIDQIIRLGNYNEYNNLLFENYKNNYSIGQALILVSEFFNTPINKEMQILTLGNRSKRLAKLAMTFILKVSQFGNSKKELFELEMGLSEANIQSSILFNYHLFLLKSNKQKIIFVLKLLYPSSTDVKTLDLPRYLYLLYFPMRPILWIWRKIRKSM